MTAAAVPLATEVAARAQTDAAFARVLTAILDAPTAPRGQLEQVAARELNQQRRASMVADFVEGAMPTRAVQHLLNLRTPQAVHRLRTRGKLIGTAVGNQTYFPAWQFDDDRIRTDLTRILELLTRFTSDPLVADRIMRLKQDELGDLSVAEALRDPGTADAAWRILTSLGA